MRPVIELSPAADQALRTPRPRTPAFLKMHALPRFLAESLHWEMEIANNHALAQKQLAPIPGPLQRHIARAQ